MKKKKKKKKEKKKIIKNGNKINRKKNTCQKV